VGGLFQDFRHSCPRLRVLLELRENLLSLLVLCMRTERARSREGGRAFGSSRQSLFILCSISAHLWARAREEGLYNLVHEVDIEVLREIE
jgi:hypothetical protein